MAAGDKFKKFSGSQSQLTSGEEEKDLTFFYMGMLIPIENTPAISKIDKRTLRNPFLNSDDEDN
jgi:hypothetical protein